MVTCEDDIENNESSQIAVLTLYGNIQQEEAEECEEQISDSLDRGKNRLVLDLTHVSNMCSSFLGMLASYQKGLKGQKGGLHLVITNPQLLGLLKITMLHRIFNVYELKEDAIRAFE